MGTDTASGQAATATRSNRRIAFIALSMAVGMLGLGFASVPLYRIFCQVTGYDGTTRRVDEAQAALVQVTDKTMSIRFDANVERGMPWDFRPLQRTDTVTIGERDMALFWAKNNSNKVITGTASFNVEPEQAARYFNKIQCFCFTEQRLQPGEGVKMPVIYYVDPGILKDPDNKDVQQITLSYTFHVTGVADAGSDAKALDRKQTGG
ncbi:cytochrome c oxidase assembly protein subunit 11 [Novosphingobium sp. PhB165]|uniref:cytochrome c oxidase assembly protein n=1 Tax=Novosphingobium sp. PhB165 TaxID=2485105 RepID=UPI0010472B73|nr:cytochrome c oxidase assembly protein [Novosphingobium sp. PhB165]TCM17286.1 cytochrome c oxidase assembly protein subunit 11 [Novosphingobium sp. PhB165]